MNEHPVVFAVERPPSFRRAHVVLRIALLGVVGWISHPLGLLWLGIPAVTAILVSRKGGRRYLDEDGPTVVRVLNWILDLVAYIALVTDQLPGSGAHAVRFEVVRSGSPSTDSALRRILTAIPSLIVLTILVWIGSIVWVLAALSVLVGESYPESWWRFLCGIVRRQAGLLAYLASLVDGYAPAVAPSPVVETPAA